MAVVRVRPPATDEYGDPLEGDSEEETITGAFTAPRTSFDADGRVRDGAVIGLSLFAPDGSDIVRTDLIEVDGELWRIDGDVGRWRSPLTGWKPGLTADLVRAVG